MTPKDHFAADGTCSCPLDGKCCECGKPCNDHDIIGNGDPIADWWCGECINRHLDEDAAKKGSGFGYEQTNIKCDY